MPGFRNHPCRWVGLVRRYALPDREGNPVTSDWAADMLRGWPARLWNCACEASLHAYAPYSNFYVGSAVLAANGEIYSGCNVECVDFDGSHAEEVALGRMMMADWSRLAEGERPTILACVSVARKGSRDALPMPAASCGKCRQKLREFSSRWSLFLVGAGSDAGRIRLRTWDVDSLLPGAFGPELTG